MCDRRRAYRTRRRRSGGGSTFFIGMQRVRARRALLPPRRAMRRCRAARSGSPKRGSTGHRSRRFMSRRPSEWTRLLSPRLGGPYRGRLTSRGLSHGGRFYGGREAGGRRAASQRARRCFARARSRSNTASSRRSGRASSSHCHRTYLYSSAYSAGSIWRQKPLEARPRGPISRATPSGLCGPTSSTPAVALAAEGATRAAIRSSLTGTSAAAAVKGP